MANYYYVTRVGQRVVTWNGPFETYPDAEEHASKFNDKDYIEVEFMKTAYPENEYGCPRCYPAPTEGEIHGD